VTVNGYIRTELLYSDVTDDDQERAAVAAGPDGTYLGVWQSDHETNGFIKIYGQLFGRDGETIGGNFQVDQSASDRVLFSPQVAFGGNDLYFVTWANFNNLITEANVMGRLFDTDGNAVTDEFLVNTYTAGVQRLPDVAGDSGGFTVVWESDGQDGDDLGVYMQGYGASGAAQGGEIPVNNVTAGEQERASVARNGAGTVVAFGQGDITLEARSFDPMGMPKGDQFTVFAGTGIYGIGSVARLDPDTANTFYTGEWGGTIWGRLNDGLPFVIAEGTAEVFNRWPRLATSWPQKKMCFSYHASGGDSGDPTSLDVYAQFYRILDDGSIREDGEITRVNEYTTGDQWIPDVSLGGWGEMRIAWQSEGQDGSGWGAYCRAGFDPEASFWDVDTTASGGSSNLNGLPELGERVVLQPRLTNRGLGRGYLGTLGSFLGTHSTVGSTIDDPTADYGTVAQDETANCHDATGDCFEVTIAGPRPGPHWDERFTETLNTGVEKIWDIHVGESFGDVPPSNLFYAFIENIFHNGVTAGGACGGYCPTDGVKRQQMAVFLLKSRFGPSFTPPPATGTIFTDVPITNPFAAWIETLFLLGVTGGCSGGPPPAPTQFCPDAIVNRQQMAVFLLKTLLGSGYVPPAAAGIFQDLPPANPFAPWAEDLYSRQVTGGCVAVPLQYCPLNPTNRQQMAAFLVKTFGLLLYGP
jgi:hypothetical protein